MGTDGPWMRLAPAWVRDEGVRELPRRWARAPEPWEREHEGAEDTWALEDLPHTLGDLSAAAGVLARFAVLRLVLRAAARLESKTTLEEERRIVSGYVALPGAADAVERRALSTALRLAGPTPPSELCDALVDAAASASARGHESGACALARSAYTLGLERGWATQAARAARAMAAQAEAGGGQRSQRLWRRRAVVLERRARTRGPSQS